MDSSLTDCIISDLNDLDWVIFFLDISKCREVRFILRNLGMFYSLLRKLVNSASLGYLVKIENTIRRVADRIYTVFGGNYLKEDSEVGIKEIKSLEEQADELYATFSEQSSSSFTVEDVLKIITSFQENETEIQDIRGNDTPFIYEIKVLRMHLKFFATQCDVESNDDMLALAGAVAFGAAYVVLKVGFEMHRSSSNEEIQSMISSLTQKIKHPHGWHMMMKGATTRALAPTDEETDDESFTATKDVLHYLIFLLWEVLVQSNHATVIPVMDQLQELYQGLRSLRNMILEQQQPKHFDVKVNKDIAAVVRKARDFILSLYQTTVEFDLGQLEDLLEAIKISLTEHTEKYPQAQSSTLPAFVDFLLEKIMELTNNDAETNSKCHGQAIQKELISLRSFLGDIVELGNDEEKPRSLWARVFELAYRVEDLMECLFVGNHSDSISASLHSITIDISNIQSEIEVLKKSEIKVKEVTTTQSHGRSTTPSITKVVIGFQVQAKSIVEILLRNSDKLLMVAIVGMPGLGKTTLAEKIYNSPDVKDNFPFRAWVVVSQTFGERRVLVDILKQVSPDEFSKITSDSTVYDVANQLRRFLKKKKYLIVFDDIWEVEAWKSLEKSFPDDVVGSRILLTSRCCEFADETYQLQLLTKEESLEILQNQLTSDNGRPIEVGDLETQIVEICGGVPLLIVIVAGVLKSSQPHQWKDILNSLTSSDLSNRCRDTLELSYRHLPEHLKPCFLYLATYQEDEQISVKKLLHLWMGEGFVRKSEIKHLSDVAEEYLKDLIDRSLLLIDKRTSRGRVKACRIHDLLHEFCLQKAKDEQFFHFLEGGYDEQLAYHEPRFPWRLCIHTDSENFMKAKVYCSRVRSLHFKYFEKGQLSQDFFSIIQIGNLLKVLDLERTCLTTIPSEIGLFVRLIYLAIQCKECEIPPSVGNLSTLETFVLVLNSHEHVILPDSFWNLQKLKNFYGERVAPGRVWLPIENLESSSNLYELDRLEGVVIPCDDMMEEVVKKFPNARKLKCVLFEADKLWGYLVEIGAFALLTHLESLQMMIEGKKMIELSLPANLKKLSLATEYAPLSASSLSSIGKLPCLEFLSLNNVHFEGDTWEMKEGEFTRIRVFEMSSLYLRCWSGFDDQFGYIEKLTLNSCYDLEEMPDCLGYSSMLQTIEISYCNKRVDEFVEKIKKEQEDNGNSGLTITISPLLILQEDN